MKIKIGFSNSGSWTSSLICWATESDVSHTFLLVELDGTEFVAEAAFSGFRLILKSSWDRDNTVVDLIDPIVPLDAGWKSAEAWLGESYGYKGLFGYIWVIIGRKIKRKWHNPFNRAKSLFCSEANIKVIQASGWPGSEHLHAASMSPSDLRTFLKGGNL